MLASLPLNKSNTKDCLLQFTAGSNTFFSCSCFVMIILELPHVLIFNVPNMLTRTYCVLPGLNNQTQESMFFSLSETIDVLIDDKKT